MNKVSVERDYKVKRQKLEGNYLEKSQNMIIILSHRQNRKFTTELDESWRQNKFFLENLSILIIYFVSMVISKYIWF